MALIFTGFEPFGDIAYNPSWDCAQAAAEQASAVAELLAVTLDAAQDAAIRHGAPDNLLVHFGVAAAREHVSLERFAHNWWHDREGTPQRLLHGGPVALESTLPLDAWAAALDHEAGLRWIVSHDAGAYVCNAALYFSLLRASAIPFCQAVFVHVPLCTPVVARQIGASLGAHLIRTIP